MIKNKHNKDFFLINKTNEEEEKKMNELLQSIRSERRDTVEDLDFRTEDLQERDSDYYIPPRVAINSDTEEDSDEDEALRAAKHMVYVNNNIAKSIEIESDFDSESDY